MAQSITRLSDYPITRCSGELTSRFELARGPVSELSRVEVDFDFAAAEVSADEFLGQRVLDVPLDRPAERTRAVRAVLARDLDDPVDDFGGQGDAELPVHEVVVELSDQERHDAPQVLVAQRLEDDDLVDAVDELGVERPLHLAE